MIRILALMLLALPAMAESSSVLIRNVRIVNGVDAELSKGSVLVEDGIIRSISREMIAAPAGALVLDGGGRVLSPGFIDLHVHLTLQYPLDQSKFHPTVAGVYAALAARFYLNNGFTTIRDAGGTHPDFARAIEAGKIYGPQVFASGAVVSQTARHGDDRHAHERHPALEGGSPYLNFGESILADGVDQALVAVRENLRAGATQVKIMGGGGVMSTFDPIHTLQPSPADRTPHEESASVMPKTLTAQRSPMSTRARMRISTN